MKRVLPLLPCLLLAAAGLQAQKKIPYASTLAVGPGDTPERVVEKAAHVVPTPNQLKALQREFIAFIHFGPNTFTRREWGSGTENPGVFDLRTLDTDQWCEAMKSAGTQMVILTAKHHDGFVLWQSRYTRHGIMSAPFAGGQGDIMRELSASCRKYGLKLGIYLSPADLYQIESPEGLYGNLSRPTPRTIPREVPGRPFRDKRRFRFTVDDYNEYFLNQLFELLTEYGPIDEVWFDGAHPKRKGGQTYDYPAWRELIRTLAPEAVIFGREDVRWCGNEAGATRDTEWNVIPYAVNPDTATHFADLTARDLGSRDRLSEGAYLHYQQAETNTSIREGWFYRDDDRQRVRSADDIFDIYERSVGGNSTFLLNIPPNREGRFSPADVEALRETGRRIRATYGTDLLREAGAKGPRKLLDGRADTYIETTGPVIIETRTPVTLNRVVLQEAVGRRGERVESHALDIWTTDGWKEVARATNIGYKRILRFPEATTTKLRLRIEGSRLTPALSHLSAHYYPARPPRLTARQAPDGTVTLAPQRDDFGWKAHGEDVAGNLSAGYRIHYTTDGSQPTASSPVYTAPFRAGACELRAVAVLGEKTGAVLRERLGLPKLNWKAVASSGETAGHTAAMAFDATPGSCWTSPARGAHFLVLDLGQRLTLHGLAYTPPQQAGGGLMARARILISSDGLQWQPAGECIFGNLVNDPTRREHFFARPVEARYVRVEAAETTDGGETLSVAELDFF